MDAEFEAFVAQLETMPIAQVRRELILMIAMNSVIDPEDATYVADEMIAGDMPSDDLGPRARVMIARCARG